MLCIPATTTPERCTGSSWQATALARDGTAPPAIEARLWRRIGTALTHKAAFAAAEDAFTTAASILGDADATEAARIRVQVGYMQYRRGQHPEARAALDQAIGIAERLDLDDVLAEALKQRGNIAIETGDLRSAGAFYERSRAHYQRLEDLLGLADIASNLGILHRRRGDGDAALRELHTALALRERTGHILATA